MKTKTAGSLFLDIKGIMGNDVGMMSGAAVKKQVPRQDLSVIIINIESKKNIPLSKIYCVV